MELGQIQTLKVAKTTNFGIYLNESGEANKEKVLLPKKQVPKEIHIGDTIEVFLYKDSEDRLIATTTIPSLTLGKLAILNVSQITSIGAFLNWGLAKDLLLPFKEQTTTLHPDDSVLVSLYIDKSKRLCATMKIYKYLSTNSPYQKNDKVSGIVYEIIDNFGAFVAVDNQYSALIPKKELFTEIKPCSQIEARVIDVKEDGKLTLSIRDKSYIQLDTDALAIYTRLEENGGFLPYHDKTDSETIKKVFNLSKNAFKRAIGHLLKDEKITIIDEGIKLNYKN